MNPSKSLLLSASLSLAVLAGCADVVGSSGPSRRAGMRYYGEGQFTDAAGAFRAAVHQDPRDYRSHYYLGSCYEANKSYHQAIQSYRASLDVMNVTNSGRANKEFRQVVLNSLALAIAKGGERQTVTESLGATKVTPAEVKFLEAKVSRYVGDHDSALENYRSALLLDSKDFYIAKEYGLYLQSLGQAPQARVVLKQAYTLNTKDLQVANALEQLGVIPGPSLKNDRDLAKPPFPAGPIPEVDWSKVGSALTGQGGQPAAPIDAQPAGSALPPDVSGPSVGSADIPPAPTDGPRD